MPSKKSIHVIAISLEAALLRVTSSRQRFLELGQYKEYLMLVEFSQFLNNALIELAEVLNQQDK